MSMKVAVISVADIRHMTPSSIYTRFFDDNEIDYNIICTKRYVDDSPEEDSRLIRYNWLTSPSRNRMKKLIPFLRYRRFVTKVLKEKRYDFLVIWNENTATLLFDVLLWKFNGRYCVNVRDPVSDLGILSKITMKVLNRSLYNTIPALPCFPGLENERFKYYSMINKDLKVIENCPKKETLKKPGETLVITYMGSTVHIETWRKMIDVFSNDQRFELRFIGPECDTIIAAYAEENGVNNVVCRGHFHPEKTAEYLEETDIINYYYNHGIVNALGIKASYGPQLRIVQICDPFIGWADVCMKYGFGFPVETVDNLPEALYAWYHSLDMEELKKGCDEYCRYVDEINQKFYDECMSLFLVEKNILSEIKSENYIH